MATNPKEYEVGRGRSSSVFKVVSSKRNPVSSTKYTGVENNGKTVALNCINDPFNRIVLIS